MKNKKNIGKRGLALLLVLVMCFSLLGTSVFADVEDELSADIPKNVEDTETVETPKTTEEPAGEPEETPEEPEKESEEEPAEEPAEAPEEEPAEEIPAEAPVYATVDDFIAACDAMGDADDEETTLAVLDGIEAVYAKMSDEDKAAVADMWAYVQSFREKADEGDFNDDIETLYTPPLGSYTAHDIFYSEGEPECYLYLGIRPNNIKGSYTNPSEGFTVHVGDTESTQRLYTHSTSCKYGHVLHEESAEWIAVVPGNTNYFVNSDPTVVKDDDITWSLAGYVAEDSTDAEYVGFPALNIGFTGAKPGTTSLHFLTWQEYNYSYKGNYACNYGHYVGNVAFSGWIEDEELINVTVKADYKLIFDANAGTDAVTNMPGTAKKTVAADTCTFSKLSIPARNGYTFMGWAEAADGEVVYAAPENDSVTTMSITLDWERDGTGTNPGSTANPVSKTLYAVWEQDGDDAPTAPQRNALNGLLGNFVEVKCVSTGDGLPHGNMKYNTVGNYNDVTVGAVEENNGVYTVTLTFHGDAYVSFYGFEPTIGTGVEHKLAPNESATKTATLTWDATNQKWSSGQAKNTVLATFEVVCKDETPPPPPPPTEPALTGFSKVRVTDANEIEKLGLTGINIEPTVKLGTGEKATLLYKITVKGDAGAKFTVNELPDATLVGNSKWNGEIPEDGSDVVIYVTMAFGQGDIKADGTVVNTATVTPGTGTDPKNPGPATDTSAAGKQFNVTVNFKTDDGTELQEPVVTDPIDDGDDYIFRLAGDWTTYSMRGTEIPVSIDQNGKTYVLDAVASANELDRLSGTIDGKDEVINLTYSLDEVGPNGPDSIPDKYQGTVTFKVVNGAWNDKTVEDVVVYFVKPEAADVYGETTLDDIPPVGDEPDDGFEAGSWNNTPVKGAVISDAAVYTYTYARSASQIKDFYARYIVKWVDESGKELKSEVRGPEAVGTKVEVTESDKADITKDGSTYRFDDGNSGNVLEGTLSKDSVVTLTLVFGKTEVPPEPPVVSDPVAYLVKWVDNNGREIKTTETRFGADGDEVSVTESDKVVNGYTFNEGSARNVLSGTLSADGLVTLTLAFSRNTTPSNPPAPSIGGGDPDDIEIDDPDVPLAGDLELNRVDHFAYVFGYTDGTVRPLSNISREEVAVIFYRLLTDTARAIFNSESNDFSDVADTRWSNREISTLANAGIINGYTDGTFRPSQSITRAEFAAIAARFEDVTDGLESPFSDTAGHWAENLIAYSANRGWVTGYADGTFRPNQAITRAESMTLINNVLSRHVDEEGIHADAKQWPDNASDSWYYFAVLEATNSHDYERRTEDGTVENWTEVTDKTNIN